MRIGINVPDDLLKRFEPIKQVTNVSQVCRDAIKTWVDTYEAARDRAREEGMEEVSARLAQQLGEQTVDWEALGYEDAKLWVQLAPLKEFQRVFRNLKAMERQGWSPNSWDFIFIQGAKTFWNRRTDNRAWFEQQYEFDEEGARDRIAQAEEKYNRSFLSYLTTVWHMVQDRVAADAIAREKALAEAQARVVLPEHLVNPKPIA